MNVAMSLNGTTLNHRCSGPERTSFVFRPLTEHISARSHQRISSAQSAAPNRAQTQQSKVRRSKSSRGHGRVPLNDIGSIAQLLSGAISTWSCVSKSRYGELMISVSASRCTENVGRAKSAHLVDNSRAISGRNSIRSVKTSAWRRSSSAIIGG